MTTDRTSSAHGKSDGAADPALVREIAQRYGITQQRATRMMHLYMRREKQRHSVAGWWRKLLDAQFDTHIGPYSRIRCGNEVNLAYLIPEPKGFCHDCGCARGEYHVFECDSEECSNCGGQAFCCECDDGSSGQAG